MDDISFEEQEKRMLALLEASDVKEFLFCFTLYNCWFPSVPNAIFFKAAALLAHLSENNIPEFNKLIQTVSIEEFDSEYIELVLNVNDSMLRFDLEAVKSIASKCAHSLTWMVIRILESQTKLLEQMQKQSTNASDLLPESINTPIDVIKDCLYVVNNFAGN
ncbi:hypothetical protein GINT2_000791 [Glugoides intestinalis]